MEGPERTGAGPESTGIEDEQLNLFAATVYEERGFSDHDIAVATPAANEAVGARRSHTLGRRPDRLQTSGHLGARGDRLDAICRRHTDGTN